MSGALLATLLVAAGCALSGLLVPRLIAAIPEPEVEVAAEEDEAEESESFAEVSARPELAAKSAFAGAVTGGIVGAATGPSWSLLFLVPLIPVGIALAVVDWRTRLLPKAVIAPTYGGVIVLVLVAAAITRDLDDLVRAGEGWLVAGLLFGLLWFVHPRGLGYGDVRLSGVLGIALGYLGWGPLLVGVYAGFLIGGLGGGLLSMLRIVERRAFAFGPFMLVGALVGIVWGEAIWSHLVGGGA